VLGWIGSFILGIGYYSVPKLRGGLKPFANAPERFIRLCITSAGYVSSGPASREQVDDKDYHGHD
jgi:hypothetical protein